MPIPKIRWTFSSVSSTFRVGFAGDGVEGRLPDFIRDPKGTKLFTRTAVALLPQIALHRNPAGPHGSRRRISNPESTRARSYAASTRFSWSPRATYWAAAPWGTRPHRARLRINPASRESPGRRRAHGRRPPRLQEAAVERHDRQPEEVEGGRP